MVESVSQLGQRRPDLLGKSLAGIESLVKNARLCIEAGDCSGLGQLMNYNQMLLAGLFFVDARDRARVRRGARSRRARRQAQPALAAAAP